MEKFIKKIEYEIKKDSNEVYHSKNEYISASGLKLIKQSPLHFIERENLESEAIKFGSMYHTFILENELFFDQYYLFDESVILEKLKGEGSKSPRATNAYKEWFNEQMIIANDRVMIEKSQYETLSDMRNRLIRHRYAKSLITNGEAEMSIYTEIELFNGQKIKVKIRPDYKKDKKRLISDLKTTQSACFYDFPRDAAKYDYHIQSALYTAIMEAIENKGFGWSFFFIAQEKSKPYAFNLYDSSPQFINQGMYEVEQLLLLYAFCIENNEWPGYQVYTENKYGINELNLPPYLIREINWFNHKK